MITLTIAVNLLLALDTPFYCKNECGKTWRRSIEFFLLVTIVIIPDVLVTNAITKLYILIMLSCDGMSDHASQNEVFHYGDIKLPC